VKKSDPVFPALLGGVVRELYKVGDALSSTTALWLVLSWICAGRAGEAATLHWGGIVLWEALKWTAVLDWWQPKKDRFRYGILFSPLEGEGFPAAELDPFRALADAAAMGALNEKPRLSKTRLYPLFPRFFCLGAAALASITTGTFRRLAVAGTVPGLKASHTATGLRAGARSWLLNNGVPDLLSPSTTWATKTRREAAGGAFYRSPAVYGRAYCSSSLDSLQLRF
jgi:hypothetical protein